MIEVWFCFTDAYVYMGELLRLDAGRTTAPSHLPLEMEEINTPLHWQAWEKSLEQHLDPRFQAYIRFGFRVYLPAPLQRVFP